MLNPRCRLIALALHWSTDEEDRHFVIGAIDKQLKEILKNNYDLEYLNNGMHELRRELRWFTLYVIAADGLIQKTDQGAMACQQDNLPFTQFADPKYSSIKSRPTYPGICYISTCIYDEIVGAIGIFGLLKDQAELLVEQEWFARALDEQA